MSDASVNIDDPRRRGGAITRSLLGVLSVLLLLAAQSTAAAQSTGPDTGQEPLACTDCHGEHQEDASSLTRINDQPCQICHTEFGTFAGGHAELEAYPHDRRTRINFDHVGHDRKHFPDSDVPDPPTACVDCHAPDPAGESILVDGFQAACGACHAGEIRGEGIAGAAGVAVITVPGLDLPSLREAQAAIGGWPELSDRELTPFMRAVFAGDPQLRDTLERFDALDPLDLRDASPADIEAVAEIAWAIKALFHDLIADGPAALRSNLSNALDRELPEGAARDMLGGLPLATVREAQAEWFPSLFQDIARHRAGQSVPIPASEFAEPAETGAVDDASGGSQESILGDDAEPSQESILGGESGDSQESILGDDAEPSQESILGEDSEDSQESILGDDAEPSQESILGEDSEGGQESILGDDAEPSQESILGDDAEPSQESILGEDTGGSQASILGDESESGEASILGGESDGEQSEDADIDAQPPQPNPEEWARLGGWYRDYFALLYRPGDHADRFLTRWLETAATAAGGGGDAIAAPVLEALAADDAPGKCVKCHTVDVAADGRTVVNWRGKPSAAGMKQFTRFAHAPHLTLLTEDDGCAGCHSYAKDADYLAGFEDRDPATFQSNFQPIGKAACADCHTQDRAGNLCIECHDYHAGHALDEAAADTTRIDEAGGSEQ